MFVSISRSLSAGALLLATAAGPAASGTTLATTTFDNDFYLFFGSQNPTDPEISLGNETNLPHFNFGYLAFSDLSGVSETGDKYLVVDIESFLVPVGPPNNGPPPTQELSTGNATIKVIGLGVDINTFASAADENARIAWYNANFAAQQADATSTVTQAGLTYFDVTDVVDGWLDDPSSNYGFGLVVTSGNAVELGANINNFPVEDVGIAATLSSVPEPTSLALLAAGAIGLMRRRR